MDSATVEAALDTCLLSDDEMGLKPWQWAQDFTDPFPRCTKGRSEKHRHEHDEDDDEDEDEEEEDEEGGGHGSEESSDDE